jgi:hypothetical protein
MNPITPLTVTVLSLKIMDEQIHEVALERGGV